MLKKLILSTVLSLEFVFPTISYASIEPVRQELRTFCNSADKGFAYKYLGEICGSIEQYHGLGDLVGTIVAEIELLHTRTVPKYITRESVVVPIPQYSKAELLKLIELAKPIVRPHKSVWEGKTRLDELLSLEKKIRSKK